MDQVLEQVPATPSMPREAPAQPKRKAAWTTFRAQTVLGKIVMVALLAGGAVAGNLAAKALSGDGAGAAHASGGKGVISRPAGAGFEARFPTAPKSSVQHLSANGIEMDIHQAIATGSDYEYDVSYFDAPDAVDVSNSAALLDRMAEGVIAKLGGRTPSSEQQEIDGRPAIDFSMSVRNGEVVAGRTIQDGHRFYTIMVHLKERDDAAFSRFADSFKIL